MGKPLDEAPLTRLSITDLFSGMLPDRLAHEALDLGPLIRWPIRPEQNDGGYIVFLIGAQANKLVFNTERDAFSHDLGWSPIIGEADEFAMDASSSQSSGMSIFTLKRCSFPDCG
jgi:hypothetical protein